MDEDALFALADEAREALRPVRTRSREPVPDPFEPVKQELAPWQLLKRQRTHDGLCDYCDPKVTHCKLSLNDDGFMVSDCQIVHKDSAVDNVEERRTFQQDKDGEKGKDHTRTSLFTKEERFDFAVITAAFVHDAAMRQHKAKKATLLKQGVAPDKLPNPPGPISKDDLETINQRFSQTCGWFQFMQDDAPGQFALHGSEVQTAEVAVRAACVQWGVDGVDQIDHTGSPVFWAITMALEMVAQRETGFSVTSEKLREVVTMDGLHEYLYEFKGDSYRTDEALDQQTATYAKGKDARAQRELNRSKRRKARVDELGATSMQRASKVATLSQLIGRGLGLG